MREQRIGIHYCEVYDTIEELPIVRWHKYNKYSVVESGIGSDLTTIDTHIRKVGAYIRKGDADKAQVELQNLRQNIFFAQNGTSPKLLASAVLVKSIDGKEVTDISDEGLQRVLDTLADVPANAFLAVIMASKKKMDAEMASYFPQIGGASAQEKEWYDLLRMHTLEVIKGIVRGREDTEKVQGLEDRLLTQTKPLRFDGERNFEIDYDRQFDRMCVVIAQNMGMDAKRMSTQDFYNAYEVIREQHKKSKKNGRH